MEGPLNIERDVVKNGVRLDCVFEGYEYRPEREEVRSQRLAGFGCVEIAENTGLSLEQVTDYCRELGLPETGSCQLQPPDGSGERRCPVCGRILVQRGNSGRRRFCSPACREEYYRQHTVEQMNEVMIEKWNKKVHARDEVVILGDLSLGNGKETNEILCRLKGRLYLIRGNHDERYLRDKDFDIFRFEWVKDYAEIHDNKRKIVLMHYPVFCYNGQFRRGADGTPMTYMLHGHIHKTEDQVLVDRFCTETRATMRKSAHQETAQPVPCQMINCFCMYSDYTPLTLEEWVECDQRRRNKADR